MALKEQNKLLQEGNKALQEKDYNRAIELFTKSSEMGNYFATYNLGCMYYFGDGVEKDEEKAFEYFIKASGYFLSISLTNSDFSNVFKISLFHFGLFIKLTPKFVLLFL